MQIFESIKSIRQYLDQQQQKGHSSGFVPTMGALHQGHLHLIEHARRDNDISVCSVYVNPTQFNNAQDLKKYPRNLEQDAALLEKAGCDALFCPSDKDMYPDGRAHTLQLDFGPLGNVLEGKFRPGHFSGVGQVLAKLFHIVRADRAYFGQKDLQQCSIVSKLIRDLFFDVQLVIVPTVRESNGLAMSSRNVRMSAAGHDLAANLFEALQAVKKGLEEALPAAVARQKGLAILQEHPEIQLEYLEVVDSKSFTEIRKSKQAAQIAVCIAAYVEGVRLIDNLLVFS